ncbi:adhesion G-protein coupled receptor G5 [Anas platyrhynchos]|uniref:adhesion G-protein coupled receptor G5 n=1 Tax=Anas platyrhynchos TaxID=8839 RepID=UPI000F7CE952|nr:adhesion G-protein coupled receptor G5 [Anas platyrhynchos]|eukprot:XP_027321896.1 adhesion G-protein coupled receptor G5 isoform X2 [Anas platyrhynchos]
MLTLLLTTLVLCLAGSVLPNEDIEIIESCMQDLDVGLEEGNPQYNWDRLNRLEQALARSKPGKEGCHFQTNLVEAHVYSVSADSFKGLNLSSSAAKSNGRSKAQPKHAMRFPEELTHGMRAREEHKLICIYIHSPCIFLDEQNSSVLNNHILGAFLQNRAVTGLGQPVEIQFWHNLVLDASNATCVFWVPGAGAGRAGSWSREGCKTEHREGTVVCHCSHLTYFAVLMIQAQNLSQPVLESLTYISTVGCSISAAATFCTLLLCCFFRRRPKDTTTRIHMNLLAALFLLNGSFLLSKPLATGTKELCQAAAALLHGSLLCSLAWMGAEAFHLYLLLVKVYNIYIQHYLLKLCLCAWGLPTLVVIAVVIFRGETYGHHAISTTDGYQNTNMCWLTSKPAHFVTLCYAGLILLFNTLMLAAVVVMLRRIKSQKGQARRDWATVLGLTCLLGTTWGLAFFSFGVLLIPQLYLFTILNSLQGLFICVWYITTYHRSRSSSDSSTSR